jgi:AraC family L-rhamnose operon regulatory protein RhaS
LHRLGNPNIGAGRIHWFVLDFGVRRPDQQWKWPGWISLTRHDLADLTGRLRQNEQPVWRSNRGIRYDFRNIQDAVKHNRGSSHVSKIMVHLSHFFLVLLESLRQQAAPRNPHLSSSLRTVELFLDDLRDNPTNLSRDWDLREMARQCGIGTTSFVSHCRQITNTSPSRYLLGCRLELAAKRLLREREIPITRIALDCGFSASQYFATQFRRRFGSAPRDYRAAGTRAKRGSG